MRNFVIAGVAAAALAACNPSAPQGSADTADAGGGGIFPTLNSASYRAEGNILRGDEAMPIVMIRDGQRMRMEVTTPEGQSVIVSNGQTGEGFVVTNAAGRTMAMRLSQSTQDFTDPSEAWGAEVAATATLRGACTGAGETGREWVRTEASVEKSVCVTQDGIILRATDAGKTVWETTNVARGPQAASLFELPPGVQVIDLNNIPGMAEALERAKAARGGN